jgi:hypothetical protein
MDDHSRLVYTELLADAKAITSPTASCSGPQAGLKDMA